MVSGFPVEASGKAACQCRRSKRDAGLIPGSGRSHGGGNGNPLQYSFLENPMDREAWQETERTYTHKTSLVVQWLRLHASKARDVGSIAGRGNEIPHAM